MQEIEPGALGTRVMSMLTDWTQYSESPDQLTRLFLSPEHKAAADAVMAAMREAGMTVHLDAVGNAVGRYEAETEGAKTLLTGSHIDTVRNAGAYDGNLGVAVPIACVEALHKAGKRLPIAIEVIAFGDEEGVRFPSTLSGSTAIAGRFDHGSLGLCDSDGVSLADALRNFGCDPDQIGGIARNSENVLGFLEIHIEQGPVLEAENLPVGVVTAINGANRLHVTVEGMAGHAGTVPMQLRQDALAGAAAMIAEIERRAAQYPDSVATVGTLEVHPGAVNVIPGRVQFTIDARSPVDDVRKTMVADIRAAIAKIADQRGLRATAETVYEAPSATCDEGLTDRLTNVVRECGVTPRRLPSGAGHDAMAMAALCPMTMLFVRCAGGISHNPAESITADDADMAARVMLRLFEDFEHS